MSELNPTIRNASRAVIICDGQLLLLDKYYEDFGQRYALPGGGQEPGETLEMTLQRECLEEIGTEVVIRGLIHVADHFKPRNSRPDTIRQLVEFLFLCDLPDGYKAGSGHRPDKHQIGVEWKSLEGLAEIPFYPRDMIVPLMAAESDHNGIYLGTINYGD